MENVPDENSISSAASLSIYNSSGQKKEFGELFGERKVIVVFIRKYPISIDRE